MQLELTTYLRSHPVGTSLQRKVIWLSCKLNNTKQWFQKQSHDLKARRSTREKNGPKGYRNLKLTCFAMPKSASLTTPEASTSKFAPLISLQSQNPTVHKHNFYKTKAKTENSLLFFINSAILFLTYGLSLCCANKPAQREYGAWSSEPRIR